MGLTTKGFVQGQFQQVNIKMSFLRKNNFEVAMEGPSSNMMTNNAFSKIEVSYGVFFTPTILYSLHHGKYTLLS